MRTRAVLLLSGLLACGPAALARAQHGFVPPADRPLHERLAEARVVAFGTVERVSESRIAVRDATAALGSIEPAFEVKRAPSRPPPWIEGDRALLLLSGARSPYRWVENPVEVIVLDGVDGEARFRRAVRELDAVRTDGAARRDLYARWCDEGSDDLRAVGLRGLLDVPGMIGSLDETFALDRARVAADGRRPLAVRRAAVRVATRHPAGITVMLEFVRRAAESGVDPEIADIAVQAGLRTRNPVAEPALLALLAQDEPELREVGLRLAVFARGREAERRLSELAVGHPEEAVRDEAMTALKKLRRSREKREGQARGGA